MIHVKRFNPETAYTSHEGTILADKVLPEVMPKAPFEHQYGYLMAGGEMGGHAHDTEEIYIVMGGSGSVVVGEETRAVSSGDVVYIPAGQWHTMRCAKDDQEPFLWAALWWEKQA